jgi:hypothetical protein
MKKRENSTQYQYLLELKNRDEKKNELLPFQQAALRKKTIVDEPEEPVRGIYWEIYYDIRKIYYNIDNY